MHSDSTKILRMFKEDKFGLSIVKKPKMVTVYDRRTATMGKLISKDGTISDIEQIMKYCSRLGDIFGYPYYFNWSTSTNHQDNSPDGEVVDIGYATFRVGKYPQHPEVQRFMPVEKTTVFTHVHMIVDNHAGLQSLVEEKGINLDSLDSIIENLDLLKAQIDDYLKDDIIKETNRQIDVYNKEYPNQSPVEHVETSGLNNKGKSTMDEEQLSTLEYLDAHSILRMIPSSFSNSKDSKEEGKVYKHFPSTMEGQAFRVEAIPSEDCSKDFRPERRVRSVLSMDEGEFLVSILIHLSSGPNMLFISDLMDIPAKIKDSFNVILINAKSFHIFRGSQYFSPETRITELRKGIMGTFIGATVWVNRMVHEDSMFLFTKEHILLEEVIPLEEELESTIYTVSETMRLHFLESGVVTQVRVCS
jgi:hypothetical protein